MTLSWMNPTNVDKSLCLFETIHYLNKKKDGWDTLYDSFNNDSTNNNKNNLFIMQPIYFTLCYTMN